MRLFAIGNREFRLQQRTEQPLYIRLGVPLFAIAASMIMIAIMLQLIGHDPLAVYIGMASYLASVSSLSEVVVRMIPLLLLGLAVYLPMRAGLWNIGAGASIYMGGITATVIGLYAPVADAMVIPAMIIGSAITGGALMFIPGYLRAKWDINEILTSLLLTFALQQFAQYAILLMPGEQVTHSSKTLPQVAHFRRFFGTRIHLGLGLAVLGFIAVYLIINRTRFGYEILAFGSNPAAAYQSGISKFKIIVGTFVIGGMLAGVAGAAEIGGIHHRLIPNFSPGYGFTAIAIALIGKRGAFRVLMASFLFAAVYIGAAGIELTFSVPFSIVNIFEAVVIMFFITGEVIRRFELRIRHLDTTEEGTPA